ncbi:hypothetical protein DBV14_02330 [Variovorax sp. KBW07]|nr:hypothetical protein DBV14_02330 [Variovorax sp. KBW07]
MTNQYPEVLARLRTDISLTVERLHAGTSPSEIANGLLAQGLTTMEIVIVFREATGASIRDLKGFGQWWSERGVTDRDAFDSWAAKAFLQ